MILNENKPVSNQSFFDLLTAYKRNSLELFALANQIPRSDQIEALIKENDLMAEQELILKQAITYPIRHRTDAKLILDIWYQAVIKETSPCDLSLGDELILSLYESGHLAS